MLLRAGNVFALFFLLWLLSPLATAQEAEVIAGGELEYQNACAVCHGGDARGNGIMSPYLTLKPANLRRLTLTPVAVFPFGKSTERSMGSWRSAAMAHAICRSGATPSPPRRVVIAKAHRLRQRGEYSAWFSICSTSKSSLQHAISEPRYGVG